MATTVTSVSMVTWRIPGVFNFLKFENTPKKK